VAERGADSLIGFAVGKVIAQTLAEIESVVVAVEVRRLGVGRELCEALLAWSREVGADSVELEVRAGNHGAIALYRKLGFAVVGQRKMYYREPVEDALLMSMALVQRVNDLMRFGE
jgi:ribosomal-protein-alanine N-acetyltransferase